MGAGRLPWVATSGSEWTRFHSLPLVATVRDAQELVLDGLTTRQPLPDAPVIRLERSAGAVVRASRALAGTGTFRFFRARAAPGKWERAGHWLKDLLRLAR